MENDRPRSPEDQHPSKSSGKGGFKFIGVELTIFSTAVIVFLIGLSVILYFYFSR